MSYLIRDHGIGAVYTQLSLQERRKIESWWHANVPVREMARVLKRHKSTIFREIKRNFWADDAFPKKYAGYFGHAAQLQTYKRTKPVMGKITKAVRDLPYIARRSITFDRGTEFVSWPHIQAEIGTQTWFCDPSSPWQKGTVENTNRRARRWLPRKRDITAVSDHELKMICDRLNTTPRKCLGWKTPAEVFREKMMEEMGRSPYPREQ